MSEHPTVFGFSSSALEAENYPIKYTKHVLVGGNPDAEHGGWLTEVEATTNFAWQLAEVLNDAEGKLLFIRKAPKLRSIQLFSMDKPLYSMIGRFSIGELKENAK